MQRSKIENYHHLVWATQGREPLVTSAIERAVFGCIRAEVEKLKCQTLALNGMPDHLHLVVKVHSTVAIARLTLIGRKPTIKRARFGRNGKKWKQKSTVRRL